MANNLETEKKILAVSMLADPAVEVRQYHRFAML
jgi:hypothetical protein